MEEKETMKPGLIQHKVRPEIKQWIEQQAKTQERSQAWFVSKIVEDAFTRAKGAQAATQ